MGELGESVEKGVGGWHLSSNLGGVFEVFKPPLEFFYFEVGVVYVVFAAFKVNACGERVDFKTLCEFAALVDVKTPYPEF